MKKDYVRAIGIIVMVVTLIGFWTAVGKMVYKNQGFKKYVASEEVVNESIERFKTRWVYG